jgi:hypothetical protein
MAGLGGYFARCAGAAVRQVGDTYAAVPSDAGQPPPDPVARPRCRSFAGGVDLTSYGFAASLLAASRFCNMRHGAWQSVPRMEKTKEGRRAFSLNCSIRCRPRPAGARRSRNVGSGSATVQQPQPCFGGAFFFGLPFFPDKRRPRTMELCASALAEFMRSAQRRPTRR